MDYSAPPMGMHSDESFALPRMRGAVLLSGGKMPEESLSPPPSTGYPVPILTPAEETAPTRMRGAVPFPVKMAEGSASAALPPWMRGAVPLPGPLSEKMPDESNLPTRMRGAVPFPLKMAEGSASAALPPWMRGAVPLPGKMSEESDLLTTTVRGTAPPAEKKATMSEAFQAIADMADRLGIAASVRDRAKVVFAKMEERKGKAHHYYTKGVGRSDDTLYAACLYIACRNEGAPRTFKELAAATRDGAAARKDIGKLITLIRKRLGDEVGGQAMDIGVVRAADYVERFGSMLGMEEQEVRAAQEAARRMQDRLDVRRNPDSTAAAIIYMTFGRLARAPKSFRDVSMASGVAEGTIKQAYKELYPHAELLFG